MEPTTYFTAFIALAYSLTATGSNLNFPLFLENGKTTCSIFYVGWKDKA